MSAAEAGEAAGGRAASGAPGTSEHDDQAELADLRRDVDRAADSEVDLAIVGGGIYGVTLALEAARRGHSAVLVERDDFGGATSWNSLRIIHGGLRYLQTADMKRFFESVAERRWYLSTFPDLVEVLPCLMPLYGGLRRPLVLRAALAANALLSAGRNRGVPSDRHLPAGEVLDAATTRERVPAARRAGLRGGVVWYDAVMPRPQRVLVEMLRWATRAGANCLNYCAAVELQQRQGEVTGLRVTDRANDREVEVRARRVVNTAGPWARELAAAWDRDRPEIFRPSLAFNVYLRADAPAAEGLALTAPRPGAPTYFLHPWGEGILAGTVHLPRSRSDAWNGPSHEDVEAFLADLNAAAPGLELAPEAVRGIFWGQLPVREAGTARLQLRERVVDHGSSGGPRGLFSVSGIKYTTARAAAERTLRTIMGGELADYRPIARPTPRPVPTAAEMERLLEDDAARAAELVSETLEGEAAVHLEDLLMRRTDWGLSPRALAIGERLTEALGWDAARSESEILRLRAALRAFRGQRSD